MSLAFVITTIHGPSAGVKDIADRVHEEGGSLFVVGDRKTPRGWAYPGAEFISYDDQQTLNYQLVHHVPADSYARKMVGYLSAAQAGAQWIRETDDDNRPYDTFFDSVPASLTCRTIETSGAWLNAYALFTPRFVWPRGYPLSQISCTVRRDASHRSVQVEAPFLIQSLADGDPDVDAIYRLTAPDPSDVTFEKEAPLALPANCWCPFNSQATTWPRALFPLMYLPVTCTFRMTDIWRSFVVQRLLPGLGGTLVFTSATVHQDRNEHDLLIDFEQEVPGYLGTEKIRALLDSVAITGDPENILSDLRRLYVALVEAGFLRDAELRVLDAWIHDMRHLGLGS